MKLVSYLLAIGLGLLGLLFVIAAGQGATLPRLAIGALLMSGAGVVVYLTRVRPVQNTQHVQVHLSGDVSLENLVCKQCGGELSRKSIKLMVGTVFITCEYCGAEYQLEEAPKW